MPSSCFGTEAPISLWPVVYLLL